MDMHHPVHECRGHRFDDGRVLRLLARTNHDRASGQLILAHPALVNQAVESLLHQDRFADAWSTPDKHRPDCGDIKQNSPSCDGDREIEACIAGLSFSGICYFNHSCLRSIYVG